MKYLLGLFIFLNMNAANCPDLTGRIVKFGEKEYDEGRLVANYYTSKDKYPKLIVYAQKTEDVQNAVKWARCHNISLRIRSGGHNHEGYSTGNDILLLDVGEMKDIQVDKSKKIAVVQPGVNNKELYTRLSKDGLTHVGGTCSDVSLSGLILTGGIGPLYRRIGLGCDALISIDMVDAKGNLIHATKDNEYKDLFWASCGGGGGNFGVVTSITLNVFDAPDVTWFNIGWDWNQPIDQVITTWFQLFSKPDNKFFSHLDLWAKAFTFDKYKKYPIKALGFYWGNPEEAKKELDPLLKIGKPSDQTFKKVTWLEAIEGIEDSTAVFVTDKPEYKSTGAYISKPFPTEGVKIIIETLKESNNPLFNVLFFTMGGAPKQVPSNATAYYYRNADFFINYTNQWLEPSENQKQMDAMYNLRKKLLAYSEGDYVGNPDPTLKDYMQSYYGENVERLRCIKKKYDPDNFFKFEQSIPPATEACKS